MTLDYSEFYYIYLPVRFILSYVFLELNIFTNLYGRYLRLLFVSKLLIAFLKICIPEVVTAVASLVLEQKFLPVSPRKSTS